MLDDLIRDKKIIVLLGAGGVGKTTSSIAVAIRAAQQGKRVALLSIDPAKRLAAALGIKLGNELTEVQFPEGAAPSGSVMAAMLDQKTVFDSMVRKHAPNDATANNILEHSIYKAASSSLGGPLEYMALAKLRELSYDPQYDLVVLDTPPDTHALDFLAKPNILAGFFENNVMTWMLKPFSIANRFGLGRLMNAGERMMGGIAKVAGVSALRNFADFLVLTQDVIEGFHRAGEEIVGLLRSSETSFVLVMVPTPAARRSALFLKGLLEKMNYGCDAVIYNRCFPSSAVDDSVEDQVTKIHNRRVKGEASVIEEMANASLASDQREPSIIRVAECEEDLQSASAIIRFAESL